MNASERLGKTPNEWQKNIAFCLNLENETSVPSTYLTNLRACQLINGVVSQYLFLVGKYY